MKLVVKILGAALLLASCGAQEKLQAAAGLVEPADAPAQTELAGGGEAAPAPEGEAIRVAARGTARLTLVGPDLTINGEYPARRCGAPFLGDRGYLFEAQAEGWTLTLADADDRRIGRQGDATLTLNGPNGRSFAAATGEALQMEVGPGFRSVAAIGRVTNVAAEESANVRVIITCA